MGPPRYPVTNNIYWYRLRWVSYFFVISGGLFSIYCLISRVFPNLLIPVTADAWLFHVMVFGTISELSQSVAFMWFQRKTRSLPLWPAPIPGIPYLSRILFQHPSLHNLLVSFLYLALIGCLTPYRLSSLLFTVLLFALLCIVDCWRYCYHAYWLFGLCSFLFPHPELSMRLILASIYFWSGKFIIFSLK